MEYVNLFDLRVTSKFREHRIMIGKQKTELWSVNKNRIMASKKKMNYDRQTKNRIMVGKQKTDFWSVNKKQNFVKQKTESWSVKKTELWSVNKKQNFDQ